MFPFRSYMSMPVRRLADFPYVLVRLRCDTCRRAGSYRLARLAVKYGAEILLDDLLVRLSADCPWRDDPRTRLGRTSVASGRAASRRRKTCDTGASRRRCCSAQRARTSLMRATNSSLTIPRSHPAALQAKITGYRGIYHLEDCRRVAAAIT